MPISNAFPWVNFHLLRILFALLCCIAGLGVNADDFDKALQANPAAQLKSEPGKQEEFLPVTEAFKVNASIFSSTTNSGKHLRLAWAIAPGYYLYQERFKFRTTPEFTLAPIYSEGTFKFDEFANKDLTVFHDNVTVTFDLPVNTPAFNLQITSQGCADAGLCYPPHTETLQIDPNTGNVTVTANAIPQNKASLTTTSPTTGPSSDLWLWQALLFALIGGVILNLMPCVFPVLSIKVMSLVQADRARLRVHGWAYTIGILLCFVGFASVLLIARKGGEVIGWGFQLQSPGIITVLAYLFFTMGLSMSGVIQFGSSLMGAGQSLTQKSGLTGSFFTGILAALVASPCTAPFMGAALGFALTQPAIACLSVFAALGFGMALPLLLLCYVPSLAERLPKPGVWMETLKEVLAFPLYLSAVWLLWVLGHQAGTDYMAAVCCGAVSIGFACWILNRSSAGKAQLFNRLLAVIAVLLAMYLPWKMLQNTQKVTRWQAYSPEVLADLRAQGRPVFIDLTADWCLTCLANEKVTLTKADVEAVFDQYNVATLKGDWTNKDPKISELLAEYDRSGVPLYLWFPANKPGKADVLPQLLTPSLVIEAIEGRK